MALVRMSDDEDCANVRQSRYLLRRPPCGGPMFRSTWFDSDSGNIYRRVSGGIRSTFVGTVQSVSSRATVVVAALDFRNLIADATLEFGSNGVVRF